MTNHKESDRDRLCHGIRNPIQCIRHIHKLMLESINNRGNISKIQLFDLESQIERLEKALEDRSEAPLEQQEQGECLKES